MKKISCLFIVSIIIVAGGAYAQSPETWVKALDLTKDQMKIVMQEIGEIKDAKAGSETILTASSQNDSSVISVKQKVPVPASVKVIFSKDEKVKQLTFSYKKLTPEIFKEVFPYQSDMLCTGTMRYTGKNAQVDLVIDQPNGSMVITVNRK